MLICNNCNSINEEGNVKCIHCHMEGDFRQQLGENKSDDTPVLPWKAICRNCGSEEPGNEIKCIHCQFPLAPQKVALSSKLAVKTSTLPLAIHSSAKLK